MVPNGREKVKQKPVVGTGEGAFRGGAGQRRLQQGGHPPRVLDAGQGQTHFLLPATDAQGAEFLAVVTQLEPDHLFKCQLLAAAAVYPAAHQDAPVGDGIEDLLPFQPGQQQVAEGKVEADQHERQRHQG